MGAEAGKTMQVRIRVGITASGEWAACGSSESIAKRWKMSPDEVVADDLWWAGDPGPIAWAWVTVDVPVPEAIDVEVRALLDEGQQPREEG